MNNENEMNEEVRQLLDSLAEHGKNARRQQGLSDLIDSMDSSCTSLRGTKQSRERRKLIPLWWTIGAAAAVLLFWLLVRPTSNPSSKMEEDILVEKTGTADSIKVEDKEIVIEEPVVMEELLTEGTPAVPQTPRMKKEKSQTESVEEVIDQPILAEVMPTKPKDTTTIESNIIPTISETPSTVQKPQRRVIRSLNLVCYECQKDPEIYTKPVLEDKTLFGQPQDPNMKNGSLAFELKLH